MALIKRSGASSIGMGLRLWSPNSAIKRPSMVYTRSGIVSSICRIASIEGSSGITVKNTNPAPTAATERKASNAQKLIWIAFFNGKDSTRDEVVIHL